MSRRLRRNIKAFYLKRLDVLKKKRECIFQCILSLLGRKEATRTPDPYVPNVVRYQLRYFPIKAEGVTSAYCTIL